MRAEEQYPGDYTALVFAYSLKKAQDEGTHETFANALLGIWLMHLRDLPESVKSQPYFLVLDAYFKQAGNIRPWLRSLEECLEQAVGHSAHRSALDRMRPQVATAIDTLKLLETPK